VGLGLSGTYAGSSLTRMRRRSCPALQSTVPLPPRLLETHKRARAHAQATATLLSGHKRVAEAAYNPVHNPQSRAQCCNVLHRVATCCAVSQRCTWSWCNMLHYARRVSDPPPHCALQTRRRCPTERPPRDRYALRSPSSSHNTRQARIRSCAPLPHLLHWAGLPASGPVPSRCILTHPRLRKTFARPCTARRAPRGRSAPPESRVAFARWGANADG
jgi:hypothetical protein